MPTSEVIDFPVMREREWAAIARSFIDEISDFAAAKYVCDRLRKDFDAVWFEMSAGANPDCNLIVEAFRASNAQFMVRLAAAYLEIYRNCHV